MEKVASSSSESSLVVLVLVLVLAMVVWVGVGVGEDDMLRSWRFVDYCTRVLYCTALHCSDGWNNGIIIGRRILKVQVIVIDSLKLQRESASSHHRIIASVSLARN